MSCDRTSLLSYVYDACSTITSIALPVRFHSSCATIRHGAAQITSWEFADGFGKGLREPGHHVTLTVKGVPGPVTLGCNIFDLLEFLRH